MSASTGHLPLAPDVQETLPGDAMTIRCKYCGCSISITEGESSALAADLDAKYTWEQQAGLSFAGTCHDCWPAEYDRVAEAVRDRKLRIHVIRSAA